MLTFHRRPSLWYIGSLFIHKYHEIGRRTTPQLLTHDLRTYSTSNYPNYILCIIHLFCIHDYNINTRLIIVCVCVCVCVCMCVGEGGCLYMCVFAQCRVSETEGILQCLVLCLPNGTIVGDLRLGMVFYIVNQQC